MGAEAWTVTHTQLNMLHIRCDLWNQVKFTRQTQTILRGRQKEEKKRKKGPGDVCACACAVLAPGVVWCCAVSQGSGSFTAMQ